MHQKALYILNGRKHDPTFYPVICSVAQEDYDKYSVLPFFWIPEDNLDLQLNIRIIAVSSALGYFLSPIDFVSGSIHSLAYFNDAAVVAACWALLESDINEYIKWREVNGKVLDV